MDFDKISLTLSLPEWSETAYTLSYYLLQYGFDCCNIVTYFIWNVTAYILYLFTLLVNEM